MNVFVGDVGGTKTYLALFNTQDGRHFTQTHARRFLNRDFADFSALIHTFLHAAATHVDHAVLGVAGAVHGRQCAMTNLDWVLDADVLQSQLQASAVHLINDLHAMAMGIDVISDKDSVVINDAPIDAQGPRALMAVGTGLGQALALPSDQGLKVVPSEGGYVDFAPRNELEIELLRFLIARHSTVAYEHVLSGAGLHSIYDFFVHKNPAWASIALQEAMQHEDAASVIVSHAIANTDQACSNAVELFVSLYGAEAGNYALKTLPAGGFWIAGGMAIHLAEQIQTGPFMRSFVTKDKMTELLKNIRVCLCLNPKLGLSGALEYAKLRLK